MRLKHFLSVFLTLLTLSVGQMWGADSGLTASAGTFVIDFYDSSKLSTTSGTGLTNNNYSSFVKVGTGLTNTNVVTSVSVTGTVRYGMNGGLTAGTGTAANANTHYVTFNTGSNFPVRKATVYATAYESGRWKLNDATASSGSLGSKSATFANVSSPLIWNLSTYANELTFKKDNGSNGTQKRLTIYTIVCEYGYRAALTQPSEGTISATPKTANENGAGWNSTLGAVVGLKSTQKVTLSASAPNNKEFDHWTVKKTASPYTDVTADVLSGNELTMPAYDVTVTVTWRDAAVACTSEITIEQGTPSNGSFSMTPTGDVCIDEGNASVTISNIVPASGYRFKEITSSNGGTINNEAKTVINISANTTINVVFEVIPPATVSFVTGAGNSTQASIAEASAGAGITLPAAPSTIKCSTDGWEFAGWSETNVSSSTTTAPTLLNAGSTYNPASDITLYAVYKQSAGSGTVTQNFTITFNDNSSDATSDVSASDLKDYVTENANKVSSFSDITKCYKGATGVKISSQKYNGSFVLNLSESLAIKQVDLNTKKKGTGTDASNGVTVGSTAFSTSSTYSDENFVDLVFTGTKTTASAITINSTCSTNEGTSADGRVSWLKSIKIYYETTGTTYNYLSAPDCCDPLGSINGSLFRSHLWYKMSL